jgi:hypothetical protein
VTAKTCFQLLPNEISNELNVTFSAEIIFGSDLAACIIIPPPPVQWGWYVAGGIGFIFLVLICIWQRARLAQLCAYLGEILGGCCGALGRCFQAIGSALYHKLVLYASRTRDIVVGLYVMIKNWVTHSIGNPNTNLQ